MHLQLLGNEEQPSWVAVRQSGALLLKLELQWVHGAGRLLEGALRLALELFVVPHDIFLHLLHLLDLLELVDALQVAEIGLVGRVCHLEVLLGIQSVLVCQRILLERTEVSRLRTLPIAGLDLTFLWRVLV